MTPPARGRGRHPAEWRAASSSNEPPRPCNIRRRLPARARGQSTSIGRRRLHVSNWQLASPTAFPHPPPRAVPLAPRSQHPATDARASHQPSREGWRAAPRHHALRHVASGWRGREPAPGAPLAALAEPRHSPPDPSTPSVDRSPPPPHSLGAQVSCERVGGGRRGARGCRVGAPRGPAMPRGACGRRRPPPPSQTRAAQFAALV